MFTHTHLYKHIRINLCIYIYIYIHLYVYASVCVCKHDICTTNYQVMDNVFMYDYHHITLPKSSEQYIPKRNLATNTIITSQHNLLRTEKPITHFSSKLPRHYFIELWIIIIITFKISNPDISSNVYYLNNIYLTILTKHIA